jgi:tRNA 2-thiocytidine biosynthesis protein TtcA
MSLERAILHKVGEAVVRFKMIRAGDRVAVGFSGGKDSFTLADVLAKLQRRSPVKFTLCAFTVDQGKFLTPIEPFREFLKARAIDWSYRVDNPSFRLIEEQPDHSCDLCSRYRRRALYAAAHELGANVIALGHTADDFRESFLRNAMFTGRVAALPAVAWSKQRDFRLIRPLLGVDEEQTLAYATEAGAPVVPCGCSMKTDTVRRSLRQVLDNLERDYPGVKHTLLGALGNINPRRMLDLRLYDPDQPETTEDDEA